MSEFIDTRLKYQIPNYHQLAWNHHADWAVPLPKYPVGGNIKKRWFVPAEAPAFPTGWLYEMADGLIVCERNFSPLTSKPLSINVSDIPF